MKKFLIAAGVGALIASSAAIVQPLADSALLSSVPSGSLTVTDWYKQTVYDPNNNSIGEVMDVLVSRDGTINALIVGVGGFLGAGEKDVAVAFNAVKQTVQNNKMTLTMNTTKDALKAAPGLKYDRNSTSWVPDTAQNTTTTR
jgi:hypothetical protein